MTRLNLSYYFIQFLQFLVNVLKAILYKFKNLLFMGFLSILFSDS